MSSLKVMLGSGFGVLYFRYMNSNSQAFSYMQEWCCCCNTENWYNELEVSIWFAANVNGRNYFTNNINIVGINIFSRF